MVEQADGTLLPFRYYFAQREAVAVAVQHVHPILVPHVDPVRVGDEDVVGSDKNRLGESAETRRAAIREGFAEYFATVRFTARRIDIGQGDATYIANGTSKVIIDGGPDTVRFGRLLACRCRFRVLRLFGIAQCALGAHLVKLFQPSLVALAPCRDAGRGPGGLGAAQ